MQDRFLILTSAILTGLAIVLAAGLAMFGSGSTVQTEVAIALVALASLGATRIFSLLIQSRTDSKLKR
jgi:hypothetical protein